MKNKKKTNLVKMHFKNNEYIKMSEQDKNQALELIIKIAKIHLEKEDYQFFHEFYIKGKTRAQTQKTLKLSSYNIKRIGSHIRYKIQNHKLWNNVPNPPNNHSRTVQTLYT